MSMRWKGGSSPSRVKNKNGKEVLVRLPVAYSSDTYVSFESGRLGLRIMAFLQMIAFSNLRSIKLCC